MITQQEVIKNFMYSLDNTTLSGRDALDEAIRYCAKYQDYEFRFSSIQDAIDNMIDDCSSHDATTFLQDYCGIILNDDDTGAITGSNAGGAPKNSSDIVPEDVTISMVHLENGLPSETVSSIEGINIVDILGGIPEPYFRFNKQGLTVYAPIPGELKDQNAIINGLYNWWIDEGLNLIAESYGENFGFSENSDAISKHMLVGFDHWGAGENTTLGATTLYTWTYPDISLLTMFINADVYNGFDNEIIENNPDGDPPNNDKCVLDRTLAHELTHAVMMANIENFDSLPRFVTEGMAELTHGIDDDRTKLIQDLAGNHKTLKETLLIDDDGTGNYAYVAGYMFLRYLAKQVSEYSKDKDEKWIIDDNEPSPALATYKPKVVIIDAATERTLAIELFGNDNGNTIDGSSQNDSLYGMKGDDLINSHDGDDIILGGDGNDTLHGGAGLNTLRGGNDNDIFFYDGGNDIITDYVADNDIIKDTLDCLQYWAASGKDLILTYEGYGQVTVQGAASTWVSAARGSSGNVRKLYDGSDGAKYLGSKGVDAPTLGSGNATAWGYGGDDTIVGSSGNTTAWGGLGQDVFSYNGGTYRIMDFDENDSIHFTSGSMTGSILSGNDIIINTRYYGTDWYDYQINSGQIILVDALNHGVFLGKIGTINSDNSSTKYSSKDNAVLSPQSEDAAIEIHSYGKNAQIAGSSVNDVINSYGYHAVINSGDGDDEIFIHEDGNSAKITPGKGDDILHLAASQSVIYYSAGDGNDIIHGYDSSDVISITGGSFSTTQNGNDVIISVSNVVLSADLTDLSESYDSEDDILEGTITLVDAADKDIKVFGKNNSSSVNFDIAGSDSNDTLSNYDDNIWIKAGAGDDSIENLADNVKISGADGNDQIRSLNSGNKKLVAFGDEGNDTIYSANPNSNLFGGNGDDSIINNLGNNSTIKGGTGNDYISNRWSSKVTINGGKGDDKIYSSSSDMEIKYGYADGYDTIYGVGSDTTLNVKSTVFSTVSSGNDMVMQFDNGSIVLVNAANKSFNLISKEVSPLEKGDDVSYYYAGDNHFIENYQPNERVQINTDFTGLNIDDNDLVINSSSGELEIQNVRDKLIDVSDSSGNRVAYVYMPSSASQIDGSGFDIFEVIVASNFDWNHLIAGSGGSSLIGGGGDNILQGGTGLDVFVYKAGNDTVTNYNSGEFLNFAATYTGWGLDENNLVINADEGSIRIDAAQNKLIEVADATGNLLAHVYQADGYEGIIDGRGFGAFEVIVGSDNVSNQIFADAAGSSLWGGRGNSNDDLYGNLGIDEYIYSYGNGNDNIFQAGSEDTVNLLNISLEQIASAEITDNGVIARFNDGGSLNISGQVGGFKLSEQTFHADYQNKIWC